MSKWIKVPEEVVTLEDSAGNSREWPFADWFDETILSDKKRFGESIEDLLQGDDIRQKVRPAKRGEWIELSGSEYSKVKSQIDKPTNGYNPYIALQSMTYTRAVLNAQDKDPRKIVDAE